MLQRPILELSGLASSAIVASRFVTYADAQAGAAVKVKGVADYPAAIGKQFNIVAMGTARLEAGAAVAIGDDIKSDALGRGIPQGGAGVITGKALTAAAAAGGFFEILLTP